MSTDHLPAPVSEARHAQRLLRCLTQPRVWLWVLLAVFAVWLRCRSLGYSEMWSDQSVTLNLALHWIHGGSFPLAADPSSSGLHNPPLVIYLYALPLRLRPDPLGVVWLIALINLAGLAAAAVATGRVFGWRVAWWATLLFVVNPWAVTFGRLIWMPSFVPAFAACLYACVLMYFAVEPKPVYAILGALSFAAVIQTHMTAVALLLPLGVAAAVFHRKLKPRPLLIAAGLFVCCFLPFVLFQFQTQFDDFSYMRYKMGGTTQTDFWLPIAFLIDLLHSVGLSDLTRAVNLGQSLSFSGLYSDTLMTLLLGGAIVNALVATFQLRRSFSPPAAGAFISLLWLSLPLLAFVRHTHEVYNYYLFFIFPTPFVLIAYLGDRLYVVLWRWLRRLPRFGSPAAAQGLAAVTFLPLALAAFQQGQLDLAGQDLRAAGAVGTRRVVDMQLAISRAKQLLAERPNCQLVVLQEEALADYSQFGLLKEFVDPARVRFAEAQKSLLIPAPCAVYLAGVAPASAWQAWLDQNTRRLPEATIHTPTQTWTFYDLPPDNRAQAVSRLQAGAALGTWTDGVQLLSLARQGDLQAANLTLIYRWAVTADLPPETNLSTVHSGNYLLSRQNKLFAQVDGVGFDSRDWRAGDVFETVWDLPVPADLPPGDYRLATAFYRWPGMERVPLAGGGDLQILENLSKPSP